MARLPLVLKGIRWRRGIGLALLAVSLGSCGAAVLGPLYARAADDSTLRDQLVEGARAHAYGEGCRRVRGGAQRAAARRRGRGSRQR